MASQLMLSSRLWAQFKHTVPCRRIASDGERLLQSRARYPVGERGRPHCSVSLDNAACPEVSDDGMIDFTDLPIWNRRVPAWAASFESAHITTPDVGRSTDE